jgi:serine/threonine-protein kinase
LIESDIWPDGSVVREKYRILGKLGAGGMAVVYKALHLRFNEFRALKVINPEIASDPSFVKRFMQEAVLTRRIQHPNAVRVDDIDESEDGRPFIVMEYIEGHSLKDVIAHDAPLSSSTACSIVKQVAAALSAAHALGVVHRDIKPANIVLAETGLERTRDLETRLVKVLDFGIAKIKESHLLSSALTGTETGIVVGTPAYMSPEQALGKRGDAIDGRSDLYSLGIVMYQMLTGDLPFEASTTMEMLLAHIQVQPRDIRQLQQAPKIPPALSTLVMACLQKDPSSRPATASELIASIAEIEAGTRLFSSLPSGELAKIEVASENGTHTDHELRRTNRVTESRIRIWIMTAVVSLLCLGAIGLYESRHKNRMLEPKGIDAKTKRVDPNSPGKQDTKQSEPPPSTSPKKQESNVTTIPKKVREHQQPDAVASAIAVGELHEDRGNLKEAIKIYREALRQYPGNEELLRKLKIAEQAQRSAQTVSE